MPTLQAEYRTILGAFARLFSKRIWEHVKILLIGAILSPAERTVTVALRVMGLSGENILKIIIVFSIVRYGRVWKPVIFYWDY